MTDAVSPGEVLAFWFGAGFDTDDVEATPDESIRTRWFDSSQAFDTDIRARFGATLERLAAGALDHWCDGARGRLAFIIVADQFSRNIHRGAPAAFATDSQALAAAQDGIRLGHDLALTLAERSFMYMPFEHSEAVMDQHTAVGLFTALRDASTGERRQTTGNNLRWAQQHRDIIVRFGRFPHRNAVLGRASTDDETEFLETASSFGQG